jgi:hypothetical protein
MGEIPFFSVFSFTILPVLPVAANRSDWRQRKAGICKISTWFESLSLRKSNLSPYRSFFNAFFKPHRYKGHKRVHISPGYFSMCSLCLCGSIFIPRESINLSLITTTHYPLRSPPTYSLVSRPCTMRLQNNS